MSSVAVVKTLRRLIVLVGVAAAFRGWHTGWGATTDERAEVLPGDELPVSTFGMRATRAIDIDAPPDDVWGWIVQIGTGKAGWYSYDLLDNLGRPSATELLDEWQQVAVGDPAAPMNPFGPIEDSPWKVGLVEPNRTLLWRNTAAGTWVWVLRPRAGGGTRLISRIRIAYNSPSGLVFAPILELGDFPMFRKMLRGIKARAEGNLARSHRS